MKAIIKVDNLSKNFVVRESLAGVRGALKGIFSSKKLVVNAINDLSFSINSGDRVAFIGPNGAGKSTTIKMLTGILHPSSGSLQVLDLTPWKDRHKLGYQIGTVFGQRTQLWYYLPPIDTFFLLSKIYEIEAEVFKSRLKELIKIFEIEPFLNKPVRQLSLGQRMRCELVASLLHKPKILFLDEPTIGLDVNAKLMIRSLLNRLSKEFGTTLFLTSHDTADIEQVCDRVIVLDQGTIIMDKPLKDLKKTYMRKKILKISANTEQLSLSLPGVKVLENSHFHFVCEIDLAITEIEHIIHEILKLATIKDMTIEDPSMEEVIRFIYGNRND